MTHCLALKALSERYDLSVVAIADVRKERLELGLKVWPQAKPFGEGMLLLENAEIDLVMICLPTYLHTRFAVCAMEKRIPVFTEKPACLTTEECEQLLEVEKRTSTPIMVGQVLRLWEEYQFLKELIDKEIFGKLKSIVMQRLCGGGNTSGGYLGWFGKLELSGSLVLDLHIHDVDFLRYILGEPDSFSVVSRKDSTGLPEHIITQYRFGNVIASAEAGGGNAAGFPFEANYRACFEKATVIFRGNDVPSITVYHDGIKESVELPKRFGATKNPDRIDISQVGPYCNEVEYFINCLEEGKANKLFSLYDGVASVRQCLLELDEVLKQ